MLILLPPSEKKLETKAPSPAINVYIGVLYQALSWNSLTAAAKKRAEKSLVIISAKYGAITPLTKIETYKEKIDNKKISDQVSGFLDNIKTDLIVDCRSTTYKTVWHAPLDISVDIQVSTVVDGVRKVVTHMSKKTRGEIARLLLQARTTPNSPEDLYAIVSEKYPCALTPPTEKEPWILEVIAI
ncbi:MAG: peroxide stress protein YaaA [Candidatus Nanopelagicaceae bacterium]